MRTKAAGRIAFAAVFAALILAGCGEAGAPGPAGNTYAAPIVLSGTSVSAADLAAAFDLAAPAGAIPGAVTLSSSVTSVYGVVPANRELQITANASVPSGSTLELEAGATLRFVADNAGLTASGVSSSGLLVKDATAAIKLADKANVSPARKVSGAKLIVPYVLSGTPDYLAYDAGDATIEAGVNAGIGGYANSPAATITSLYSSNLAAFAAIVPSGTTIAVNFYVSSLTPAMIPTDGELILSGGGDIDAPFALPAGKTLTIAASYVSLNTAITNLSGDGVIKVTATGEYEGIYSSSLFGGNIYYKTPAGGQTAVDVAAEFHPTAAAMTTGAWKNGTLADSSAFEWLSYSPVTAGTPYTVTLDSTQVVHDVWVSAYNQNGVLIGTYNHWGSTALFNTHTYTPAVTGTIYIKVTPHYTVFTYGAYALKIQ
jgi:hypothetical protein